MTPDYGSRSESDAAAYERHHYDAYADGPDRYDLAEWAAELADERRKAAAAVTEAMTS